MENMNKGRLVVDSREQLQKLIKEARDGGKKLKDLYIGEMDLSKLDFSGLTLKKVFFSECNLNDASFKGSHFEECQITACSAQRVDFSETIHEKTECRISDLSNTEWNGASIPFPISFEGCLLRGATLNQMVKLEKRIVWVNCDLEGMQFDINYIHQAAMARNVKVPEALQEKSEKDAKRQFLESQVWHQTLVNLALCCKEGKILLHCRSGHPLTMQDDKTYLFVVKKTKDQVLFLRNDTFSYPWNNSGCKFHIALRDLKDVALVLPELFGAKIGEKIGVASCKVFVSHSRGRRVVIYLYHDVSNRKMRVPPEQMIQYMRALDNMLKKNNCRLDRTAKADSNVKDEHVPLLFVTYRVDEGSHGEYISQSQAMYSYDPVNPAHRPDPYKKFLMTDEKEIAQLEKERLAYARSFVEKYKNEIGKLKSPFYERGKMDKKDNTLEEEVDEKVNQYFGELKRRAMEYIDDVLKNNNHQEMLNPMNDRVCAVCLCAYQLVSAFKLLRRTAKYQEKHPERSLDICRDFEEHCEAILCRFKKAIEELKSKLLLREIIEELRKLLMEEKNRLREILEKSRRENKRFEQKERETKKRGKEEKKIGSML